MPFTKGHKLSKGRPKGATTFSLVEFAKELKKVEWLKKKSLYRHAIERAFEDDRVLCVLLNKILPAIQPEQEQTAEWIADEIQIVPPQLQLDRFKQYLN